MQLRFNLKVRTGFEPVSIRLFRLNLCSIVSLPIPPPEHLIKTTNCPLSGAKYSGHPKFCFTTIFPSLNTLHQPKPNTS